MDDIKLTTDWRSIGNGLAGGQCLGDGLSIDCNGLVLNCHGIGHGLAEDLHWICAQVIRLGSPLASDGHRIGTPLDLDWSGIGKELAIG